MEFITNSFLADKNNKLTFCIIYSELAWLRAVNWPKTAKRTFRFWFHDIFWVGTCVGSCFHMSTPSGICISGQEAHAKRVENDKELVQSRCSDRSWLDARMPVSTESNDGWTPSVDPTEIHCIRVRSTQNIRWFSAIRLIRLSCFASLVHRLKTFWDANCFELRCSTEVCICSTSA